MSTVRAFLGKNAFQVDAKAAEEDLRKDFPSLLHSKETVEIAFQDRGGKGRDKSYFTSRRIIIRDAKGIGTKRTNFLSIPYEHIECFQAETAGAFDGDMELRLYTAMDGCHQIDFATGQVNIFQIYMFLSDKVFSSKQEEERLEAAQASGAQEEAYDIKKAGTLDSFFNFMGNNATELDTEPYEQRLKTETPVLIPEEKVELVYKVGRDSTVFTSRRILFIDVKGMLGKKVEFFSLPWKAVSAFSVETAGAFVDRDTTFNIMTSIKSMPKISQDLRNGKANLFALQRCISNHVLGKDTAELDDVDKKEGHVDHGGLFKLFGDKNRPLDAVEINQRFHTSPQILQPGEVCEYAFQGRRDMVVCTTKRLMLVDPKGLGGVKVEYTSFPWKSVVAFGVRSAGSIDVDSEALIWTNIMHDPPPPPTEDNPSPPPLPGISFLELDFNKKAVDIKVINRYLSARCLVASPGVPISNLEVHASPEDSVIGAFLSKIGNDQREIDPREVDTFLHTECHMLLDDENVVMAFKAGRDMTVFTNRRIMLIDTQGITGKRVEYSSVAYAQIRAFSAESAGAWDRDSEMEIFTRNFWTLNRVKQDFRNSKADIVSIQKFLAAMVLGNFAEASRFTESTQSATHISNPAGINSFLGWLTSNSTEEDAQATNEQLHSDPPILLDDEVVIKAYRTGRDFFVYTNKRIMKMDVQGIIGKKVCYLTVDVRHVAVFSVETAGHLDRDAEIYIHNDIPDLARVQQDVLVKKGDVMDVQNLIADLLLFSDDE